MDESEKYNSGDEPEMQEIPLEQEGMHDDL